MADASHADLRAAFGPVRDQGRRPTCLVFAGSSTHEHARNDTAPLSPEALFASAKKRDGLAPAVGTTVSAMLAAMEEDGQCTEAAWPYGNAAAVDHTATYRRARGVGRTKSDLIDTARERLANGSACLLVVRVTDAWFAVGSDGVIASPAPGDRLEGRHAVVAVGYDDSRQQLFVRNSWGTGWGDGGYARMPYDYLELYGIEAVSLETLPDAAST